MPSCSRGGALADQHGADVAHHAGVGLLLARERRDPSSRPAPARRARRTSGEAAGLGIDVGGGRGDDVEAQLDGVGLDSRRRGLGREVAPRVREVEVDIEPARRLGDPLLRAGHGAARGVSRSGPSHAEMAFPLSRLAMVMEPVNIRRRGRIQAPVTPSSCSNSSAATSPSSRRSTRSCGSVW